MIGFRDLPKRVVGCGTNVVALPQPTGMSPHVEGLLADFTDLVRQHEIVAVAMVALPHNGGPILGFTKNAEHAYRFGGSVSLLHKRVMDWLDEE